MSTPAELMRALGREARASMRNGTSEDHSIRTFRGRSVEDIIPQIQRELGADAIIVRRRDGLAGGVLGFFQHPYVEIEAMSGPEGIDVYDDDEPVGPPYAPAPPQAELEATAGHLSASPAGASAATDARAPRAAAGRAVRQLVCERAPGRTGQGRAGRRRIPLPPSAPGVPAS